MSHRSEEFRGLYRETVQMLKKLMGIPQEYEILLYSSATECMERIVQNLTSEKTYHLIAGAFGSRFWKVSHEYGREAEYQQIWVKRGEAFDYARVQQDLQSYKPELLGITHNETSTGTQVDMAQIYKLKQAHPHMLTAVDTVSSVPVPKFEFQFLDATFFSVQKVFGLPAGLGVLILSPQAVQRFAQVKQRQITGSYFSFQTMLEQASKEQTPQTPNVLDIYLLNRVMQDFWDKGLEKIREQIETKARILYEFLDNHPTLEVLPKRREQRSITTLTVATPVASSQIIEPLKAKGLYISPGYGQSKSENIRLANFPATSVQDIEQLVEEMKKIDM
jgi:phosphoserine aminotransferase